MYNLENLSVLTPEMISKLLSEGINDLEKLTDTSVDNLANILGITQDEAIDIINAAFDYIESKIGEGEE